jgi:hypothetical protein
MVQYKCIERWLIGSRGLGRRPAAGRRRTILLTAACGKAMRRERVSRAARRLPPAPERRPPPVRGRSSRQAVAAAVALGSWPVGGGGGGSSPPSRWLAELRAPSAGRQRPGGYADGVAAGHEPGADVRQATASEDTTVLCNLRRRFPGCPAPVVSRVLQLARGHGGDASQLLRRAGHTDAGRPPLGSMATTLPPRAGVVSPPPLRADRRGGGAGAESPWVRYTDQEGDAYYANHATGEVSWAAPAWIQARDDDECGGGGGCGDQRQQPSDASASPELAPCGVVATHTPLAAGDRHELSITREGGGRTMSFEAGDALVSALARRDRAEQRRAAAGHRTLDSSQSVHSSQLQSVCDVPVPVPAAAAAGRSMSLCLPRCDASAVVAVQCRGTPPPPRHQLMSTLTDEWLEGGVMALSQSASHHDQHHHQHLHHPPPMSSPVGMSPVRMVPSPSPLPSSPKSAAVDVRDAIAGVLYDHHVMMAERHMLQVPTPASASPRPESPWLSSSSSPPPEAAEWLECVFQGEHGCPLGLVLEQEQPATEGRGDGDDDDDDTGGQASRVIVNFVQPGSLAASEEVGALALQPGMVLTGVALPGSGLCPTAGRSFEEVLDLTRSPLRPLGLYFQRGVDGGPALVSVSRSEAHQTCALLERAYGTTSVTE